MKYLLDTDICIYLIKEKPHSLVKKFQKIKMGEIGISVITQAELEYGVQKSQFQHRNKIALAEFLAPLEMCAFEEDAAQEYGKIRAHLERKGTPIGSFDLLIAAQAKAKKCILVTNNEREFKRIPDLKIENWAS